MTSAPVVLSTATVGWNCGRPDIPNDASEKPSVVALSSLTTVNSLWLENCGGMLPGHEFYGYLQGGASGGILPASLGDVPLDFDTLQPHGSFIGSAAVVVL